MFKCNFRTSKGSGGPELRISLQSEKLKHQSKKNEFKKRGSNGAGSAALMQI